MSLPIASSSCLVRRTTACGHGHSQGRVQTFIRCQQHDEPVQESSSFRNNLRKGFAPLKREKIKQQNAAAPSLGKPLVLGADDFSMERWREVDKKMNKYPGKRTFTAIGSGGDEFKAAMVKAVEAVVGPVQPENVTERPSSKGAYISVKVAVVVTSPEQVVEIFANMKTDSRLKWFM